jgi:hypothetical protein
MATETPADTGTPPGNPAPDIWTFSPEQASKQLAEMKAKFDGPPPSATPTSPREARQRLEALGSDVAWQERYAAGDIAARDEFQKLTEMVAGDKDPIPGLLRGEAPPNEVKISGATTSREMAVAIAHLREDGITDPQIHELLSDKACTPEEIAAVQRLQTELHGTAAWVQKLLAGDHEAKRDRC